MGSTSNNHINHESKLIEQIINNESLLAIIIRSNFNKEGIEFFTPNDFSQQLAYMNRPKGYIIHPHYHNKVSREVTMTKEVLIIKKGKIRVNFYNEENCFIESRTLIDGDIILLANGGHGFDFLERTEIIEVKQGPYLGDNDKTRFRPSKPKV